MNLASETADNNIGVFNSKNLSVYNYGLQNPIVLIDNNGLWAVTAQFASGFIGGGISFGRSKNGDFFFEPKLLQGWGASVEVDPKAYQPGFGTKLDGVGKANQNNDKNSVFTAENGGMDGALNSKNLALYSYASQNPVRMLDPDGNSSFNFNIGQMLGAAISPLELPQQAAGTLADTMQEKAPLVGGIALGIVCTGGSATVLLASLGVEAYGTAAIAVGAGVSSASGVAIDSIELGGGKRVKGSHLELRLDKNN
jgi:hypothetical protein